jgi:DNA-binding NarL/FixJ family response regulator
MKIRIIIADDYPIVRSGIRAELSRHDDFEIVGEAVTTDEVIEKVDALLVNIILLDLNMPGMKAIDVIKLLKRTHPKVKILVLTAHGDKGTALGVMKAGADGYVLKDEDPYVIQDAIRAVVNGKNWLSSSIATFMIERIRNTNQISGPNLLTEKESEVIRLIAEGMTTKEIALHIGMAERTVELHITNIYKKLGVNSRASAIRWASENGIIQ